MLKYKYLLFDMDGTIADTDEMIYRTYSELFEKYGNGVKKEWDEIMYFSGPPLDETLKKYFPHMKLEEIRDIYTQTAEPYYQKTVKVFPHEIETLQYLKSQGYRLAVVTNKATYKAYEVLVSLNISSYFDFVIGREDVSLSKPSPEGILKAIDRYQAQKEECLYLGDNDIDYITASNAGVDCLIVSWGPRKLNVLDKCKYSVDTYEKMEEIL